ncbi:MAG: hypothetical protein LBN29_06690 [Mediterranea sp.]|jgi:heme/copper-type cytochrome/quinol oxidase subunit 2|nr:hypothetical protein [Mediterranea sp.]
MSKLTYKVSYYVLYALFAVIIAVLLIFYLGGDARGTAEAIPGVDPSMAQPIYTGLLIYLMYGLFLLAVALTVIAAVFQFGAALKDNPGGAIKSLLGLVLLVVLLVVTYTMGDGTNMHIQGYEDLSEFWFKITDMFLYSIYILLGVTILAMLFSAIKKRLS